MDTSMPDADSAPPEAEDPTSTKHDKEEETQQSPAPAPSSDTGLSSVPPTDSEPKESESETIVVSSNPALAPDDTASNGINPAQPPAQAADLSSHSASNVPQAEVTTGAESTSAVPESTMNMATPSQFAIPAAPASGSASSTPRGRGGTRGRPRTKFPMNGGSQHAASPNATTENGTPVSGRGRGRGRGGGRPRGSGRGRGATRGAARGGKRKRGDDDDDDDDDEDDEADGGASDSSIEITPVATATRSGRSVQKPTTFVPPPPSPTTNKRKRPYNHRNPQAAVCKLCLRGTSPASNPVVFCDGCNAPYHRWCHKPPIEQVVIDKEDAEWYCKSCADTKVVKVVPPPVTEVASFVSVSGASEEERRKYFAGLTQGMLVTLLVKATTFRPDLPVFDSKFKDQLLATGNVNGNSNGSISAQPGSKGKEPAGLNRQSDTSLSRDNSTAVPPGPNGHDPPPDDAGYTSDVHPENYPRPGQGLMSTLPPETEDLEWLVDDSESTFTHLYHEPPKGRAAVHSGDGLV